MAGKKTCRAWVRSVRNIRKMTLLTFIRAFESFPVHCLYLRPSLKRRRPGNAGDAAMLENTKVIGGQRQNPQNMSMKENSPTVNVIHDTITLRISVNLIDVLLNPSDNVILEGAFDELMEEVGGEKLMDICTGKMGSKRLDHRQHK